ncbi:hypothetical protein [Streptomyces sp. C10-9-1]|uniref:hypothetical protein n=1 Tax=Streptomyces sp. C10-9-1 TaxID=1859285 RepID=UPI003F49C10B
MDTSTFRITYRDGSTEVLSAARAEEGDTSYALYGPDGTVALLAPRDIVRSVRRLPASETTERTDA